MNRRIAFLSVALLALAGSLSWLLRQKWIEAQSHERAVLEQAARSRLLPPLPPAPTVTPASPAAYVDVAQKTLFSSDRNPNVQVDPPKPPPPPPPMPALPVYYGQMHFNTPVVILAIGKQDQKSYAIGDKVGEFLLEDFDRDSITFDWDGKTVQRKLADLAPKDAPSKQAQQAVLAPAPPQPVQAAVAVVAPAAAAPATNRPPQIGAEIGGGYFSCVPGDASPSGTVVGQYKKALGFGLMGPTCHWEQMK